MRTYGRVWHEAPNWWLAVEPQVMIRLKSLFSRLNKRQFHQVCLRDTPETCRDIEWFMDRYALEISPEDERRLIQSSRLHTRTLADLERMMVDYTPAVTGLALPLRAYQALAIEIYWKRYALLVADQLGLGKSVTALGSLLRPETLPAIIICQSHLPKQWQDYVRKFLPRAKVHIIKKAKPYALPGAEIYILNYHKMSGWVETLCGQGIPLFRSLIFDEVQELRHNDSEKYCAAKALRAVAAYAMGLSATPIYNYGGEIFNVMEVIAPGALGDREEFDREWCSSRGRHMLLNEPNAFGAYLKEQFLMLARTRQDVGRELPPVHTVVQAVEFDELKMDAVDTVATELAHRILTGTFHEQGEAARQFDMALRQATGVAKAPFVAAFVAMLVAEGESVLLTGWHRAVYDVWATKFTEAGIKFVSYTGEETTEQKNAAKEAFLKRESPVMFMSLRSGAGLDGLQEVCHVIVHGELDWSPGVHEQCRGRLFRDGQTQNVTEFYLVSDGGSDPTVADVLGLKTAQVQGLLGAGGSGLTKQTDTGARVKEMAKNWLKKKGKA